MDSETTVTALSALAGKTIVAVHRELVSYAPSGMDIKYALEDGEEIVTAPSTEEWLVEFTDGTLLLVSTTYDGELVAELVGRDHPDAQRIMESVAP